MGGNLWVGDLELLSSHPLQQLRILVAQDIIGAQ